MFKLADADGFGDYPPCNIITILQTNIAKFQQMLNEANEKIEQLEGKKSWMMWWIKKRLRMQKKRQMMFLEGS